MRRTIKRRVPRRTRKTHGGTKATSSRSITSKSNYTSRVSVAPYSRKPKLQTIHDNESDLLLTELISLLKSCKETEEYLSVKPHKKCMYGDSCKRHNPEHFHDFAHSDGFLAAPFKLCTDQFIDITYNIYMSNQNSFPTEWYVIIAEYLRTFDYNKFDTLYFNILANLCIHHDYYSTKYNDKQFWEKLYMGFEEGAAVTGMFDVSHIPIFKKCLADMNSIDKQYLSNTALIFSKSYGSRT